MVVGCRSSLQGPAFSDGHSRTDLCPWGFRRLDMRSIHRRSRRCLGGKNSVLLAVGLGLKESPAIPPETSVNKFVPSRVPHSGSAGYCIPHAEFRWFSLARNSGVIYMVSVETLFDKFLRVYLLIMISLETLPCINHVFSRSMAVDYL